MIIMDATSNSHGLFLGGGGCCIGARTVSLYCPPYENTQKELASQFTVSFGQVIVVLRSAFCGVDGGGGGGATGMFRSFNMSSPVISG